MKSRAMAQGVKPEVFKITANDNPQAQLLDGEAVTMTLQNRPSWRVKEAISPHETGFIAPQKRPYRRARGWAAAKHKNQLIV